MDDILLVAGTGVLTYAAHSAAACLAALGAGRLIRNPHHRDVLWKTAFVAPIATSMLTLALRGRARLFSMIDVAEVIRRSAGRELPGRDVIVHLTRGPGGDEITRRLTDPVATAFALVTLSFVAAAVSIATLRAVRRWRARSRRLAARIGMESPTEEITFSRADSLPSPVAIGRREICIPTRVATEFLPAQRKALVAHELAHLNRRDPTWFAAIDAITALSAFQPLVFAVARSFRRDVELICDESAVRATGDRAALIGALALLAAPFDSAAPLGAVSAYDGGPLLARAKRIANVQVNGAGPSRARAFVLAAAAAAGLMAVPTVAPAGEGADLPVPSLDAARRAGAPIHTVVVDSAGRRIERKKVILVR